MGAIALAQATSARAGQPNAMRTGTVVSVGTGGVVVSVGGGNVTAGLVGGAGAGVAPGATVSIFKQGSSWLVGGVIAGPATATTNAFVLAAQLQRTTVAYAAGVPTGSEFYANRFLSAVLPLGHLIEVSFMVNVAVTIANASAGYRIREGTGITGTAYGSGHTFGPTSGFSYEGEIKCHVIGDGTRHIFGLTVQNFTGGLLTLSSLATSQMANMILDLGDATGVTIT